MAGQDLGDLGRIIERLDERGRLIRITSEVDPVHDLAGVAARLEGRGAAVLFELVKGHDRPVFTGLYWSRALLADLLEQPEKQLPAYVSGCIKSWQQSPMPPVVVESGPVVEVTQNQVDLSKLPIPTHALKDGGPYFDAAVVIA
jgi:2,5-furandicarboxylate decarboxylase 1